MSNSKHIQLLRWLACTMLATLVLTSCSQAQGESSSRNTGVEASKQSLNLTKVIVPKGVANRTVHYSVITVNFNSDLRIPNSVAYELTAAQVAACDAPTAERRKNYRFECDYRVPGCAETREYTHSGYDRGHMAPANDFKWSRTAMTECFYMTNICPQSHELNNGAWKNIENRVHNWASTYGKLVVVTGPVLSNRMGGIGPRASIAVPGSFFKVVYAPRQQRAIAFVYANEPARGGIAAHVTTVRAVEKLTGLNFFSDLPDNLENKVETQTNKALWLNN